MYLIDWTKQFLFTKASPQHIKLGRDGENIACKELKKQAYKILARNWLQNKHEIDIIAREDDCLVFVEVRTRQEDGLQSPEQSFSPKKQLLCQKAAQYYMFLNQYDAAYRFDFVAVTVKNKKLFAKVYKDVIRK